ncbi:DNA cytosine methyltransferase [Gemmata sp. G18]|uniref:DNA (cytosine-5-)-methyltransferase n=1 Tax=Gemmata palustris TaxID=2822762 RepID=A0ABS5BRF5_9BACT|nr:DNA cytosine methyltransferase [Gemmata palustris]MBP3955453.1 DNA cytosine methyltransferase [Gemmata palustris]
MTRLSHGISFSLLPSELIVDNFAGGGGASLGIEMALGRSPDIAINHDREAIAMHWANHPSTRHYCEDVWEVNPAEACAGRPVGLAWFSPDCKHFSKAKGGKPVSKKIRGLAWIVVKWAKAVQPRVIILENVEEFQDWGPLDDEGYPCPERKGKTFQRWLAQLRNLGYVVEWRELRACDYSAPTIRKRLFIVARRDGQRIVWPEPTHASPKKIGTDLFTSHLQPWRTAAECIDWSIPCPSIFERKKPLAENTLRRVAAGLRRYVIDAPEPFIISLTHHGGDRVEPLNEPFRTVTGAKRGEKALVTPYLVGAGGPTFSGKPRALNQPHGTLTADPHSAICVPTLIQTGYGEREGQAPRVPGIDKPLGTVVAGGPKHALVAAFLAKHYGGVVGHGVGQPIGTVTASDHHSLVTSNLVKLRGTCRDGQPVTDPMATISAQGLHLAEVRAFLVKYFGTDQDPRLDEPMHTVTAKHRFGLVTVYGEEYLIADIGLRMLTPRELYRAQGFHEEYIIDLEFEGKPLTKTAQVRMCGNSVSPPNAAAMVRAQFGLAPMGRAA